MNANIDTLNKQIVTAKKLLHETLQQIDAAERRLLKLTAIANQFERLSIDAVREIFALYPDGVQDDSLHTSLPTPQNNHTPASDAPVTGGEPT